MLTGKPILLTGKAGFVGASMRRLLTAHGEPSTVILGTGLATPRRFTPGRTLATWTGHHAGELHATSRRPEPGPPAIQREA